MDVLSASRFGNWKVCVRLWRRVSLAFLALIFEHRAHIKLQLIHYKAGYGHGEHGHGDSGHRQTFSRRWLSEIGSVVDDILGPFFFKIFGNCGANGRIIAKQTQEQGHGHEGRTLRYVVC